MIVRHAEHIGADIVMYELLPLVNLDADTTYCPVDEMDVPAAQPYERRVGRGEMRVHNPLNKERFTPEIHVYHRCVLRNRELRLFAVHAADIQAHAPHEIALRHRRAIEQAVEILHTGNLDHFLKQLKEITAEQPRSSGKRILQRRDQTVGVAAVEEFIVHKTRRKNQILIQHP